MPPAPESAEGSAWTRGTGHWVAPIAGQLVTQLRFDYAVTLLFEGGLDVRIEHPFVVRWTDGSELTMDPESDHESLAPVLRLRRATAVGGRAFDDGRLELAFAGGSRLSVGAGKQYEAWQFSGPQGALVVSVPGGALATWIDA